MVSFHVGLCRGVHGVVFSVAVLFFPKMSASMRRVDLAVHHASETSHACLPVVLTVQIRIPQFPSHDQLPDGRHFNIVCQCVSLMHATDCGIFVPMTMIPDWMLTSFPTKSSQQSLARVVASTSCSSRPTIWCRKKPTTNTSNTWPATAMTTHTTSHATSQACVPFL